MAVPQVDPTPHATRHESGLWEDDSGLLGPLKPGRGPRIDPAGEFPTGPDVGTVFPDIVATAHTGDMVDLHEHRNGQRAVVVFHRSAVW